MDVLEVARRLADDTLFPAALATDAADAVPVELLDALAQAGLYGLVGPASAGGLEADFPAACAVVEALASGCLTTTFVWTQHISGLMAAASTENDAIREWVPSLCRGERRAGLALAGARSGTPSLSAREVDGAWSLSGRAPFVSGWGRIDVMHTAARTGDGRLLWAFVDAEESDTLTVERLGLMALDATATVKAEFREHVVPESRVTSIAPFEEGPTPPPVLRMHAAFALGVTGRCCRLLGTSPLSDELEAVRAELDRLDPATIEAARGAAGVLALRAAASLATAAGSRSLLRESHEQRLAREALFCLIYALRPGSHDAVLRALSVTQWQETGNG
jgi:alkylation response protein AidB-like acyl-CoA dehydrogenase